MKTRIAHLVNAVAIVAAVGVAGLLYSKLPDPVPTHWNFQGQPDGFTAKPMGAFLGPAVMTGVWLLSLFTSRASAARAATRRGPAVLVHTLVIVVIGVVSTTSLLAAVKQAAPGGSLVRAADADDLSDED